MHTKPTFQRQPAPTLCTPRPLKSSTNNTTASNRAVLDEKLFGFKGERSPNFR